MRFEVRPAPDPPHRRSPQPGSGRHRGPRPVRRVLRFLLQRRHQHLFDLVQQDRRRRPGLGSSIKPFSRIRTNRPRHLLTVLRATPSSAATWALVTPGSAQANTIRDRNASACDDLARRDQRTSCSAPRRSAPAPPSDVRVQPHHEFSRTAMLFTPKPREHPMQQLDNEFLARNSSAPLTYSNCGRRRTWARPPSRR